MRTTLGSFLLVMAWVAETHGQTVPPAFTLEIGGPTYFPDGAVKGATARGWRWTFGEPLVAYVTSGSTLCDSRSAGGAGTGDLALAAARLQLNHLRLRYTAQHPEITRQKAIITQLESGIQEPTEAGYGWRVEIVPVSEQSGVLHVSVIATRLWDRGRRLDGSTPIKTRLSLRPGVAVVVDRIATDGTPVGACDAIGMGLEIGLAATVPTPVVETELWLVHGTPDGRETSSKQIVRGVSGGTPYIFPNAVLGRDLSGTVAIVDQQATLELVVVFPYLFNPGEPIAERGGAAFTRISSNPARTVATVRFQVTDPNDVVSVPLTVVQVKDGTVAPLGDHQFSLRLRNRRIR
jgi:hypothetical protein